MRDVPQSVGRGALGVHRHLYAARRPQLAESAFLRTLADHSIDVIYIKRDKAAHVFGAIPGHPAGTLYESRGALSRAGVHRPLRAGISGSASQGADSIVLSGGYEDDRDDGDMIIYTGQGGRDPRSGKQRSHQMLLRGSLALSRSRLLGLPVRVVRGSALRSRYAPERGYRYDGLYRVSGEWKERGRAGFLVWRFRLEKIADGQE